MQAHLCRLSRPTLPVPPILAPYPTTTALLRCHSFFQIPNFIAIHSFSHQTKSILDMTTIQALHRAIAERLWDTLRELPNVGMIKEVRKPQISIDNIRVEREKVLPNRAQARILVTERSDEDGWLAIVIELVVDTSLRQYGTLVLRQSSAHLRLQTIFKEETGLHVGACGED